MMRYLFLLLAVGMAGSAVAQIIPTLPNKDKPAPKPQTKVIVKSNDRDDDGLTDAIDQCPDQKGPVSNYGCPEEKKKNYASVTIGNQIWMQENLNVDRFRNGDIIPEVKSDEEWERYGKKGKPAWCYYNNNPENRNTYGKLYNWYAVNDPRGLAPEGWHVSTWQDWVILYEYLGKRDNVGEKLKSVSGWKKYQDENEEIIGNGTDIYGFSAFPGGYREMDRDSGVSFFGIGTSCFWWTSTKDTSDSAYVKGLYNEHKFLYSSKSNLNKGLYVRCVKD